MGERFDVAVLGAELQAAVSMALARPDLRFLFLSECDVVDGWDLPNVSIRLLPMANIERDEVHGIPRVVILCPTWYRALGQNPDQFALTGWLGGLRQQFPEFVLPVFNEPPAGFWLAKGDLRHRPDLPLADQGRYPSTVNDDSRCGVVYQPRLTAKRHFLTMGYRSDETQCALGTVEVYREAFAREAFLLAGESVDDPIMDKRARAVLSHLRYTGYFSINWVCDIAGDFWLTSLRPVPRALFRLFRAGNIDLLEELQENSSLPGGLRFVVTHHYSEYH